MSLRLDDINMRENAIRVSLQTIDSCLLKLDDQTARNSRALAQLRHAAGIHGSPPPWENPAEISAANQKAARDPKVALPHRLNTPPQRMFSDDRQRTYNEDRLRPFTDYYGGGARQRPTLQHGMSVDQSELEQRFGGMMGTLVGGVSQHGGGGLSQSDEAVPAGNPPKDLPDGGIPGSRLGRSLSVGRTAGSPRRTLSLRGAGGAPSGAAGPPLHPIVTPTRLEYTSITDCIDTSCMERAHVYSPPNTPDAQRHQRQPSLQRGGARRGSTGSNTAPSHGQYCRLGGGLSKPHDFPKFFLGFS